MAGVDRADLLERAVANNTATPGRGQARPSWSTHTRLDRVHNARLFGIRRCGQRILHCGLCLNEQRVLVVRTVQSVEFPPRRLEEKT